MNFDWQTEEESEWERPLPTPDEPGNARRPYWLLLAVALIIAGVFYGVGRVRDTVDQATSAVKDDVRTAHELARRAALQSDEELLVSVLSGRSAEWVDAQKERLEAGLLFENTPRPFGFEWQGMVDPNSVTLSADLSEAVLESRHAYAVKTPEGVTATVTLSQTHVYRQGDRRWLLSPPLNEFWGNRRGYEGPMLSVTYPQRDEAFALRLTEDIESSLDEMCREVAHCPDGFDVRLRLETEAQSILLAADAQERMSTGSDVTLPTPTLVGLPGNDEAYESLLRGYVTYVVSAALTEVAAYQCCRGVLYQQALLNLQMAELNLAPDPVLPGEYLYLIDVNDSIVRLRRFWEDEELPSAARGIPLEIYAFLDYVRANSGSSVSFFEMQKAAGYDVSFWEWLEAFTAHDLPSEIGALQANWSAFVREQVQQAQTNLEARSGRPRPAQDVVLLCGDDMLDVYRLHSEERQLRLELGGGYRFGTLAALPADDGYIVAGDQGSTGREHLETQIKLNGRQPFLLSGENIVGASIVPTSRFQSESGKLVSWLFSSSNSVEPRVGLIDVSTCTPGGCQYEVLPGTPYWSPDGSQVLAVAPSRAVRLYLRRGDDAGWKEVVDHGYEPFWLDNQTFAFFPSYLEVRQRRISAADLDGRMVPDLVTIDGLRPILPEDGRSRVLRFAWINRHPFDPDALLAAVVGTFSGNHTYLVALRRSDGNVPWLQAELKPTLLHTFEGVLINLGQGVRYSPSGRWLTLMFNYGQGPDDVGLTIYDLQANEVILRSGAQEGFTVESARGDWSADGRWYVRSLPGAVDIIAPGILADGRPYRQLVAHDLPRCESPQWVDGEK